MPSSKKWAIAKPSTKFLLSMEETILPKAIEGDFGALCHLLLYLSEAIRRGIPLTPKLADYLADELRKIADSGKRDDAFHIRRGKGERDTREAVERNLAWAVEIKLLKQQNKSMSVQDAIGQVAQDEQDRTGRDHEEAIRKAWGKYRDDVKLSDTPGIAFLFGVTPKKAKRPKVRK